VEWKVVEWKVVRWAALHSVGGMKWMYGRDSGSRLMTFGSDAHAQGGTLNNLGVVRYSLPCQPQAGATNTNVGLRGPPQF